MSHTLIYEERLQCVYDPVIVTEEDVSMITVPFMVNSDVKAVHHFNL